MGIQEKWECKPAYLRYSARYLRDYIVNCIAQETVSVMLLYLTFVRY